jgi:hypothetical protein
VVRAYAHTESQIAGPERIDHRAGRLGRGRRRSSAFFGRWSLRQRTDAASRRDARRVRMLIVSRCPQPYQLSQGTQPPRVLVAADDPDIRKAITGMYRRFHARIRKLIETNREGRKSPAGLSADATAWAMIGLATVSNIIRELELRDRTVDRPAGHAAGVPGDGRQVQESVGRYGGLRQRRTGARFTTTAGRSRGRGTTPPRQ